MSISRGMDKEDVVHIYNGILLSLKKKHNYAIWKDAGTPIFIEALLTVAKK